MISLTWNECTRENRDLNVVFEVSAKIIWIKSRESAPFQCVRLVGKPKPRNSRNNISRITPHRTKKGTGTN
jgi:hypothetical protein